VTVNPRELRQALRCEKTGPWAFAAGQRESFMRSSKPIFDSAEMLTAAANGRGGRQNKAVIDRRLPLPGAATWEVTLSARKAVPCVRWPVTSINAHYSQAQGCVCTALQLGGDVEQPWLMSKFDVVHKTGNT